MKKNILKSIIYKLLINKINNIILLKNNNIIINKLNNNTNNLQKYNNTNDNLYNIYKFNNNNLLNILLKNNIVSNILIKYFNSLLHGNSLKFINNFKNIKYIISKPIFKDTNNKLNIILFIYNKYYNNINNNNINNNILLIRMIDNIYNNNNNNNINKILTKLYNKNVTIEPIILKYDYFNNNIFSNNISYNITTFNTYKNEYTTILNNNITLLDRISIILNNTKYKNLIINILNNNLIYNISNNNNNNNNIINNINIKEYLNLNNTIYNLLNNKYIIGYSFKFTGKLAKSLSTARKLKYIKYKGSLKHNTLDNKSATRILFNLNNYKSNISISNTNNINKNGKYNVNIKLGHI